MINGRGRTSEIVCGINLLNNITVILSSWTIRLCFQLQLVAFKINFCVITFFLLLLVVAPVVPELDSDIDTTNFDDIANPEGGEETFAVTKVERRLIAQPKKSKRSFRELRDF
jgi:hypothetical protein